MSTPEIVSFLGRRDEFTILGVEQAVTPDTDFAAVWDAYFATAGTDGYECIVWYFRDNALTYLIGSTVEGAAQVPEGCVLVPFPASDYLVVTHEWLPAGEDLYLNGNVPTQEYAGIGQIFDPRDDLPLPDGYVRDDGLDGPLVQIEIEASQSENGTRFERWVPVKKR